MIRNTVKTRQSWWPFRGCVAGKRMVFVASVLNRVFILCESVLNRVYNFVWVSQWVCPNYSQISPWGQLAITDTPIKRTAAKSPAKTNHRRLTEINFRYYGLSLKRTLTRGPKRNDYNVNLLYCNCQKKGGNFVSGPVLNRVIKSKVVQVSNPQWLIGRIPPPPPPPGLQYVWVELAEMSLNVILLWVNHSEFLLRCTVYHKW